ncbi:MAG: cyclic nucleotide-binding domain-containing protein [Pseudomonadota bacterium]
MIQRQYRPGEVIFRVGETSRTICRLAAGRAELISRQDGAEAAVAVFEAGDMVGEVEALSGRPRDATLRALTEVEIDHLKPGDFLQWVSEDRTSALDLIQRLSTALQDDQDNERAETDQAAHSPAQDPAQDEVNGVSELPEPPAIVESATNQAAPKADSERLMLFPGNRALNATIPNCGMEIGNLPFTVGRMSERREPRLVLVPDLLIEESSPFLLSRAHFLIARESNGIVVRDLGSTHGTLVNGTKLGDRKPDDAARLKAGENRIQAGGAKSPYIFKVVLPAL